MVLKVRQKLKTKPIFKHSPSNERIPLSRISFVINQTYMLHQQIWVFRARVRDRARTGKGLLIYLNHEQHTFSVTSVTTALFVKHRSGEFMRSNKLGI